ncbi:Gmad2 immunoglobulin-like domain-containing protein [Cellulosilyticum sp. I15G10I2]|uniref:Gmad2 immunoglobulin-like domain-containing protein n=1 Tax=Cellulosilyticum sp. I15G10I2 TaxID=1892843 RepID=UPI00085C0A71|nr:Gmad2 immunoglobulin-like domain-containing protein [Cellulosilyticum sp. I15G10I2]
MKKKVLALMMIIGASLMTLSSCGKEQIISPKEEQIEKEEQQEPVRTDEARQIVLENEAFKIYEPTPNAEVQDRIVVRGLARVYEGTIRYEFEDGHYILDEGFATASAAAPEWGEFEIIIKFDEVANYSGTVILFEESAQDGSRINQLQIPVTVTK